METVHHGIYNAKSKNHSISDPDKNENDFLGHNGQDAIGKSIFQFTISPLDGNPPKVNCRGLFTVGAVAAAVPTDFQEHLFCTQ